ncbi:hypothetical protein INR49_030346 [Caranx melampygus]|nr:hypothetical protein INR49_030346 [Caranx melampygus]
MQHMHIKQARGLSSGWVQAQLQLDGVTHSHPHLHPHLAAHAPYLMFPPPPFGLPIASLADSASAAAAAGLLRGQWLSPLQAQITSQGPYKHMWMSV